ncbi:MAG: protease SohB [Bdellovibrionota bacterium]
MEFWSELGLFAAKTGLIVFAFATLIILGALLAAKAKQKPELEVDHLNEKYKHTQILLKGMTSTKEALKSEKKQKKKKKENVLSRPKLFVLDFKGDMKASAVDQFRDEITSLLLIATPQDRVAVRVESPGGVVHGYGLAASQMLRVRERGIPLTACVDKVAASGGYLMACTANQILSAPFGIIGSIGVIAQVPNFNRILKKNDVDYKEYTAGEFKRTVSIFGPITEKGEEKFLEQLEQTHTLFKKFVGQNRPQLQLETVATGEYWFGTDAQALGLVDEIRTSDDFILSHLDSHQILHLKIIKKQPLREKLSGILGQALQNGLQKVWQELDSRRLI